MPNKNLLDNGRFLHDLDNWTVSGATYSAGDGDEHYGVAVLSTGGDYIEQDFAVRWARVYTFEMSIKPVGGTLSGSQVTARIQDGDGNTVLTQDLTGATVDTWEVNTFTVGLASGTTYMLRITNAGASGDVRVDDVWVWWVPITRAGIAARVHAKLTQLATDASLSPTASGALTEGDYTYAVDSGLRTVGAIDPETDNPDIRCLEMEMVDTVLDAVELEMLEQLQRYYAVLTDIKVGSRDEKLSQITKAISGLTSGENGGGAGNRIIMRDLEHERKDFVWHP